MVGDLLQTHWGVRLERFGPGPDGGIDLRRGSPPELTIVQCKHYAATGFTGLKAAIAKEARRLRKLAPNRYVVATSVNLSPQNKAEIIATCAPFVKGTDDVFGGTELAALLRAHPDVEAAHPKLWSQSAEVLRRLLNAGVFTNTAWTMEQAETDIKIFVRPDAHAAAREMLRRDHATIIAGPPGIGKTTLARMLLLEYVREGFEPIGLKSSIDEGFDLYKAGDQQVFYFDDFLGQTDISERALGRNEDDRLVRFTEKIRASGKRLIMTTREYLLRDAQRKYEQIARARNEGSLAAIVLDLSRYSRLDRGRLLYNHVWDGSAANESYCKAFAAADAWKPIVDHSGFNPRIIRTAIARAVRRKEVPDSVPRRMKALLDNPAEVWQTAFDSQLLDAHRRVLRTLTMLSENATYDSLFSEATARFHRTGVRGMSRDEYRAAMDVLEGDFIQLTRTGSGALAVRLANPSVRDFLLSDATADSMLLTEWLESAQTLRGLVSLLACVVWGLGRARDPSVCRGWLESAHGRLIARIGELPEPTVRVGESQLDLAATMHDLADRLGPAGCSNEFVAAIGRAWPRMDLWVRSPSVRRLVSVGHLGRAAVAPWIEAALARLGDDWDEVGEMVQLLREHASLFSADQRAAIEAAFIDLAETERNWALTEADDEDQAVGRLDDIDAIADALDLNSPVQRDDREDVASKFRNRGDAREYDEGRLRYRPAEPDGDDEISRLFSTFLPESLRH